MKLKTQIKKSQWWVSLLVAIAVYFAVLIGSQLNVVVFSGGVLLGLIILPVAFIKCIIDEWKEGYRITVIGWLIDIAVDVYATYVYLTSIGNVFVYVFKILKSQIP